MKEKSFENALKKVCTGIFTEGEYSPLAAYKQACRALRGARRIKENPSRARVFDGFFRLYITLLKILEIFQIL